MRNKNFVKNFGRLSKRFAKFMVAASIAVTTCSSMNFSSPDVINAEDVKQTFYIETNDDGSSTLGRYLGVDGTRIQAHVIKGGDDSIAFCLGKGLKFPHDSHSDNPTIYSKSSDDTDNDWSWSMTGGRQPTQAQVRLIQRALYAGYPTKTPTELGFDSDSKERMAYYATQVAIWTVLEGWNGRVYKLEGADESENKIIDEIWNAYNQIMDFTYAKDTAFSSDLMITNTSNRNQISTLKLTAKDGASYKESENLTVRPVQPDGYATDDKLGLSFSVGFEGDVPEGAKIVDSNGNECYDFGQGTSNGTVFRIQIPVNSGFNGSFKVVATGTFVRNAPLLWNTANTAYQTLMQFGAVQGSSDTELTVVEQGNASGSIIVKKLAQVPAGYDGRYETIEGVDEKFLVNELKYSYHPQSDVSFGLYYKNDGPGHFADEMVGRLTTNSKGEAIFNNVPLDSDKGTTEFYIKELSAPAGLQLDKDKKYEVALTKVDNGVAVERVEVTNDAVQAYLTLNKKLEVMENNASTIQDAGEGIYFGVYLNENALGLSKDSLLKIVKTDANGEINTGNLPLNHSYYLKELKPPVGYSIDTNKYTFNLTGNALVNNSTKPLHFYQVNTPSGETVEQITNYLQKLNLKITKQIEYVDDNGKIAAKNITKDEASQFEFTVYSDSNATKPVGTMTFDETVNGFVLGELDASKTYYVKETKAPSIYEITGDVIVMNNNNATKTVLNKLDLGSILITKHNDTEKTVMPNIEFTLTGTNAEGKTVITMTKKTNSNGQVLFDKLPGGLKYTVKETVPDGYKNITGNINADFTQSVSDIKEDVHNQEIVKDINIKVIKTNETETVNLKDVEFELYKKKDIELYKKNDMFKPIATGKTDENGELRFSNLDKEVYILKETSTNMHYELPEGEDALTTVDLTGVANEHTEVVRIKNKSIPLKLQVFKVNGETSSFGYYAGVAPIIGADETLQKDVTFKLYKLVDGVEQFITEAKTNDKGIAEFTNDALVYGETYVLKEVPVDGYKPLNDLRFTIANDMESSTAYVKAVNEIFNGKITVIKRNEADEPLPNVEFKLYKDTTLVATKVTNKDGKIVFDNLKEGVYSVVESKTNSGYVLDTTPQTIILNTQNPEVEYKLINKKKPIQINIIKTIGNEENIEVIKDSSLDTVGKDDVILDGVEFGLYKGETLIQKVTTKDGVALFDSDKIVVGEEYTIKELSTPSGYKGIDDIKVKIDMSEADKYSVINVHIKNKLIKNAIEFFKYDEKTKKGIPNTEVTLYRSALGNDKSDIVSVTKTDENGIARFEGLVNGTYYVAETKAAPGYELKDDERIEVVLDSTDYVVKKVSYGNDRKTVDVSIIKEDRESKEKLQNAGFSLYQVEDGKETLVDEGITDDKGMLSFYNLDVGYLYKLVETRVPDGYTQPEKNFVYFEISMNSDATTLKFTVENDKVETPEIPESYSKIKIMKVDEDSNEAIPNTEFEIYRIVNNQDIFVDKGMTDKNGEFITKELFEGYDYKIVETKPADGYEMPKDNEHIISIPKNSNGKVFEIVVKNKKTVDDVSLKIVKVDKDDNKVKLENAEFSVYKKEKDNKITLVYKGTTDKNGELVVPGLKKGEVYTVLETKAPENYKIEGLASQNVEIKKDETRSVIEHVRENTKIVNTTPQTGDESNNNLMIIIGGTAFVLAGACVGYLVISRKKRK